jgi:hypothetical protein
MRERGTEKSRVIIGGNVTEGLNSADFVTRAHNARKPLDIERLSLNRGRGAVN